MGGGGRLAALCEHLLSKISLVIPDNRDISFAIERIIDFSRSIRIHCTTNRYLNARNFTCPDYVIDDYDRHVHFLHDSYVVRNISTRVSQISACPDFDGLLLYEFCSQTGLRIIVGLLMPEKKLIL